ncbi:helix-turn-helix domain-containing protein [Flavobacterium sp. DG2-3]|uniref:helix-turn-helix transcriptional regulator n=1 Tax=Flavobacterium sp. DG2-3 TaxID=3068317 RepID=UPI00273F602C|nr:helix-turn-helix domain-containing protein [Flavobacterium sp. DG2-3]MDP5201779.1 helix-turn-helix domain-containing protein [Flavobacterium sp. DG2-3]
MEKKFEKYKGIHPGAVLKRELDKRNLAQRPFAQSVGEYPQTLNAIIQGRRNLTTSTALKIENALHLEEGTLMILQVYFDIEKEKKKQTVLHYYPNVKVLRKSLFWDTDINKIEWTKQSNAVIKRVFERGNISEKKEMVRFYGASKIRPVLDKMMGEKEVRNTKMKKDDSLGDS